MEDFAGYAADDLVGWKERKDGETKQFPGVLCRSMQVSRTEAEQMVLRRASRPAGSPKKTCAKEGEAH